MSLNIYKKSSYQQLLLVIVLLLLNGNYQFLFAQKVNKNTSSQIIKSIVIAKDTIAFNDNYNHLTVKQNDIIEFIFCDTIQQKYKYYLNEHTPKKINWSYKNSTFYHNLATGNYTFTVLTSESRQEVNFRVISDNNSIVLSSILLIVALIITFIILSTFLFKKNIAPSKLNPITPIIKKYIKPVNNDKTVNSLTHKATRKYEKATVLFADIQGFTKIVEHLNPETLIDELDRFFIHFDEVAEKYKIEKIKTIGDAYMCAGGLPDKNSTNPIEVILAAIEMQQYMKHSNLTQKKTNKDFWELRIGVHTGPVISGIVGRKKLSFDIWGDSVNIASRMESSGVAGKINVSGVTYNLIKDFFVCEYRGKMPIKYKGETDMYFVNSIVPKLSIDQEGLKPNEEFFTKLQWIRYNDLEESILNQLNSELPTSLKYHNAKHTIDVCTQVEVIGRAEGLNQKELLLAKTAALFHDTGFMVDLKDHETHSVRFAQQILPKYQYTRNEIETISQLILVTHKEAKPTILMEKVLKDADLDYLGRADFIPLSEKLWEEICHSRGKISRKEWNKRQKEFLSKHIYYTNTAQGLRQVNKEIQLKKITALLK